MKDTLSQLYNGFLLRDVLGYIVPGSFVLGCVAHYIYIVNAFTFSELTSVLPTNIASYLFVIGLCYACGHFLSGVFFHLRIFSWLFRYSPRDLSVLASDVNEEDAWTTHRFSYQRASKSAGDATLGYIERHAALVHFTGHFSAGILFTIIYICCVSIIFTSFKTLLYCIPLAIIFPGILSHHRQLVNERFKLERRVIEEYSATLPQSDRSDSDNPCTVNE